ncbi:hypothetical protein I6G37_11200 [Serratia rubidaea]|nr:hypothetical protein I6G37_11200 [Serratia rubidaea]
MNWINFIEEAPPKGKWQEYHFKTCDGEVGTSLFKTELGFYTGEIDGREIPAGTIITQWAFIQ